MNPDDISRNILAAQSDKLGHGGKLDEESVKAMFADSWNNDFKLEVIAGSCPPAVREILMRRVKELTPWWKRILR